jgi:hypothetical protein
MLPLSGLRLQIVSKLFDAKLDGFRDIGHRFFCDLSL